MIVMNEILPNPVGSDSQDGLLGEWVELYNNGDTAVDIAGWKISELSDPDGAATENMYTIVADSPGAGEVRTSSGSTVIGAGNFLVIVFDAARLNNTGDTVALYDGSSNQMDRHAYVDGEAPEGKSIARIPDGVGFWVDPIPTPGSANIDGDYREHMPLASLADADDADTEAPIITIYGNNPAYVPLGTAYNDLGAGVTDNVNDNLGVYIERNNVDTSQMGEYEVVYRATDGAGNTTVATRLVIVYNPALGVPAAEGGEIISVAEGESEGVADSGLAADGRSPDSGVPEDAAVEEAATDDESAGAATEAASGFFEAIEEVVDEFTEAITLSGTSTGDSGADEGAGGDADESAAMTLEAVSSDLSSPAEENLGEAEMTAADEGSADSASEEESLVDMVIEEGSVAPRVEEYNVSPEGESEPIDSESGASETGETESAVEGEAVAESEEDSSADSADGGGIGAGVADGAAIIEEPVVEDIEEKETEI
jgi:hypothetical protein